MFIEHLVDIGQDTVPSLEFIIQIRGRITAFLKSKEEKWTSGK